VELERGREAFARRAWRDAYDALSRADQEAPLGAEDLELLSTAASMVGLMDVFATALERAHHAHLAAENLLAAAWCAGFLGMSLATRGELGPAAGWFARAQRLVERDGRECPEQGFLLLPVAMQQEASGEYDAAYDTLEDALAIATRFGNADLSTLALNFQGLVRIKQGRIEDGLRRLDESMVGVTADEVSPFLTGAVYCGVIAYCEEAFEVRRAHEWTNALQRWCDSQPQMVSFTGRCLAHRAGILQRHGNWSDALEEARLARERCDQAMNRPAAGQALYQQGELHRLQGAFDEAEAAYRDASRYGREPQPGLALLRLAQGNVDAAAATIGRAVDETSEPLQRAVLLPAYAEIALARNDLDTALASADELAATAERSQRPMLTAIAAHVRGAVDLARGDARAALAALREASQIWRELDAPHEVARVRMLLGLACRALGDDEGAALEHDAARAEFERLGAGPDIAHLDAIARGEPSHAVHGLSNRELEVLRLVAAGKTNRQIASELVVSEHTVARHVQNIFAKLGVSSRTAATAFAFEHELV
jgi:DNA-binding CsgD family transcriptional regulator